MTEPRSQCVALFRRSHLRRGKFCVRTVRPLYREAIGLFCLWRMRGMRTARPLLSGARGVMSIVRWMKSSVASLPRMLASLAALGVMKYGSV
jgi:hypothetical protein